MGTMLPEFAEAFYNVKITLTCINETSTASTSAIIFQLGTIIIRHSHATIPHLLIHLDLAFLHLIKDHSSNPPLKEMEAAIF
jgi:hypothetical protein